MAFRRRTEGKLAGWAAGAVVVSLLLGVLAFLDMHSRQGQLDDAVERRASLTAAALDIYRRFADADASSLDAVLVDPERAAVLRQRHREAVFDAIGALREAAARDPGGSSADRVKQLTDLVPEYVRLVETGWLNTLAGQPVGTSYLAQASFLVRDRILTTAQDLYREQTNMLAAAQRAAGHPAWPTFTAGVLAVVVLVAAQRFVTRRTRRRVNLGLAAATLLTLIAMAWPATVLVVVADQADDSATVRDDVVAPLAEARNLGRAADGDEARLLIFPRLGDINRLRTNLDSIEKYINDARKHADQDGVRDEIDEAADALRSWREADKELLQDEQDEQDEPRPILTYREVAELITGIPENSTESYATQLDQHLTSAIDQYTDRAATDTASARETLAGLDAVLACLAVLAGGAAVAGLWPRIAEYYR